MAIQFKRGTSKRWLEINPILDIGEPGFEYDTGKFKIGNGKDHWKQLPYQGSGNIEIFENFEDLPVTGVSNIIYSVTNDRLMYQWNSSSMKYESFGGNGSFDPSIITNINGGNANG